MAYDFMNESGEARVEILGKLKSFSSMVAEEGCNTCPKKYPLSFRDSLSYREFKISGLCQKCQDEVFKVPKETSRQRKFNFYD